MIQITRDLARQFRAAMRRAGLHKNKSPSGSLVQFIATADECRIRAASGEVALEYRLAGSFAPAECWLPLDVLELAAGRLPDPVTVEPHGQNQVSINWIDRGVPQSIDRAVATPERVDGPDLPEAYTKNEPKLWSALGDAVATADRERLRYALDCVQLRGGRGEIVATDGRHGLLQRAFRFPWENDVLVPANCLLGEKSLCRGEPVTVGLAGDWVTFGIGPWLISLRMQKEVRFPRVDDCIPAASLATSQLTISPVDAAFLRTTLPGLPCDDAANEPVTLDLNGEVIVRGKTVDQSRPTELVLTNSQLEGEPVTLNMNRRFLARAIELGFRRVSIFGPEKPAVCHDDDRHFVWALLSKEGIIKSAEDAIRVETSAELPQNKSRHQRKVRAAA